MNAARRKRIESIQSRLAEIGSEIDEICIEEQDYYDNMPESFQSGEKGARAEVAWEALEQASTQVEDACQSLSELIGG